MTRLWGENDGKDGIKKNKEKGVSGLEEQTAQKEENASETFGFSKPF